MTSPKSKQAVAIMNTVISGCDDLDVLEKIQQAAAARVQEIRATPLLATTLGETAAAAWITETQLKLVDRAERGCFTVVVPLPREVVGREKLVQHLEHKGFTVKRYEHSDNIAIYFVPVVTELK